MAKNTQRKFDTLSLRARRRPSAASTETRPLDYPAPAAATRVERIEAIR
jgi:hypothetical protein